ncbi:MAG TPA: c-type cytochrome [Opitutaceae bacterium]|nr:c-type cytochrome [Opitutaceae bacterium]
MLRSLLLLFCAGFTSLLPAQQGDRRGEVQAPPPEHIKTPPAPPLSVEDALKTFRVAPGFHLEVVAAEPLVFDPVTMAFGADGRLWVVEMRAYMPNIDGKGEDQPIGSIAVLEDTNGDGRMDKRTVFLDGLVMPRAISLVADGALIAEPPHLWFARDKNGDGVADEKIEVAGDYGGVGNPEHMANGLLWAMDNWIYSANHTTRYRYLGDGKFSGDTTITRGQWGITQDDAGRLYYNSNSDPLRGDVVPSRYLKRNPNFAASGSGVQLVPANLRVWPARVTTGINRGYQILNEEGKMNAVTAACGTVIYRGNLFPAEFQGNAFIAEPAGNLVKRIVVEEREGTLAGRNAYDGTEFLASTDERFRPVNLFNGPDGALYVVDMYRGVIQHRTYVTTYLRRQVEERQLERPVGMGRIYRVAPNGAAPANFKIALAGASLAELVQALGDANGWTRDTAQRLLVQRGLNPARTSVEKPGGIRADLVETVAPVVRDFAATAKNPLGRVQAMWTLDGLGEFDRTLALRALADADARVRVAAVRLAEKFLSPALDAEIFAKVSELAASAEPAVRLQVALSLGEVRTPAADSILQRLAVNHPGQPLLRDAVLSGLAGREDAFIAALTASVKEGDTPPLAAVAFAASAVLKSGDALRIERLFATSFAPASPAWVRRAVLDGVQRFLPRSPEGKSLAGSLPVEPRPLVAFAATTGDPDAAKARQLLASLKWPGKAGEKSAAVVRLTAEQQALFEKGRAQFAMVCAACHQPTGQGLPGLAPALVNSRWVLGDERLLARIVLSGKARENLIMPPMRAFDDETLAGVLTFIRRSWGHQAAPVAAAVVAEARTALANREEPYTDAELDALLQKLNSAAEKK